MLDDSAQTKSQNGPTSLLLCLLLVPRTRKGPLQFMPPKPISRDSDSEEAIRKGCMRSYLSAGSNPDYQCDALLHGLKSLYGAKRSMLIRGFSIKNMRCPDRPDLRERLQSLRTLPIARRSQRHSPEDSDPLLRPWIYGSIHRDQSHLWHTGHYKPRR